MNDLSNEKIKEALNNYRATRNFLWGTLVVITGGTIGLFFRALNVKNCFFEVIFIIIGIIAIILFMKLLTETNDLIDNYYKQLK